jgi:hypothetical protein
MKRAVLYFLTIHEMLCFKKLFFVHENIRLFGHGIYSPIVLCCQYKRVGPDAVRKSEKEHVAVGINPG